MLFCSDQCKENWINNIDKANAKIQIKPDKFAEIKKKQQKLLLYTMNLDQEV